MLSRDMKALHSRETSSIFITITILNKNVPQENDGYTVIIITVMLPTNWRKEWQSTPVLLPGESHGQKKKVCLSNDVHRRLIRRLREKILNHFMSIFSVKK